MDTGTYKLVVIGFDMVPREIGNYTMFEIQDFVRYAKAINPCTTATISTFDISTFDSVAIVVHKIDTSYSACTAFDGKEKQK